MVSRRDKLLSAKIFLCGFSILAVTGSLGAVVGFKLHYDAQIEQLTQRIEALQAVEKNYGDDLNVVKLAALAGNLKIPEIAQTAGASVVGIKVTSRVQTNMGRFGTQILEQSSQGSGIIYNTGGFVITSYHVVENHINSGGSEIEVFLADGRFAAAAYIGGDEQNDLAVIKIELDYLPAARFGRSGDLRAVLKLAEDNEG